MRGRARPLSGSPRVSGYPASRDAPQHPVEGKVRERRGLISPRFLEASMLTILRFIFAMMALSGGLLVQSARRGYED